MGDLSRNFSRAEFDVGEPYPDLLVTDHLLPLVARAQWLRDLAASPAIVTSAFRSPARNAAIPNASGTSQHMDGDAVDLLFPLASLRDLAAAVISARAAATLSDHAAPYAWGQLIFYPHEGHVHLSLPASRLGERNEQLLVATGVDANGRDVYALLTDPQIQLPALSDAQKKTLASSFSLSWSS